MSDNERLRTHETSPESAKELEAAGHERRAELERSLEKRTKETGEADADKLHHVAEKLADREPTKQESPVEKRKDTPRRTKKTLDASFEHTMSDARSHMKAPSRAFSKLIHAKPVEKASEAVGATVARPNAILAGSLTAFVFTLAVYWLARRNGYPLSGFESIAAFIIGWVVGIFFDYFRVLFTGKR